MMAATADLASVMLSALVQLQSADQELVERSPKQWTRFPAGWNLTDAEALRFDRRGAGTSTTL